MHRTRRYIYALAYECASAVRMYYPRAPTAHEQFRRRTRAAIVDYVVRRGKMRRANFQNECIGIRVVFVAWLLPFLRCEPFRIREGIERIERRTYISLNGSHRSIDRIITLFSRNCNFKSEYYLSRGLRNWRAGELVSEPKR